MKNENSSFNKFKPVLFLGFGVIMVITAICLLLYDRFMLVKDEVFTEIEMRKAEEKNNSELMDDDIIDDDIIDDPTDNNNNNKTNNK